MDKAFQELQQKKLHFFTICYAVECQTLQERAFDTGKVICQWCITLTLKEESYSQILSVLTFFHIN